MHHSLRYWILIVASVAAVHARDIRQLATGAAGDHPGNVILVVADGLRWQEVFRGADSLLLFGDPKFVDGNGQTARRKYWRPTARERRQALMPFLWNRVAHEGQLFGNRDFGSAARVTNPMHFSYPGYNEMLVGIPDPRIDRNDFGPNPNVTVFEWLNRRSDFRGRVAAVGTWSVFHDIFNERRSGVPVRDNETDALTQVTAMRQLTNRQPRALFVGFGQTDDFAHKARYDLTLDAAHAIDRYVADLWKAVESMPRYRGRTTLIVVADHGRGRTARDWTDHGNEIGGSDETWLAVIGPQVSAAGEHHRVEPIALAQTAATVAAAVGLDYVAAVTRAAAPIALRIKPLTRVAAQ
jgi:hypothetical protein